MCTCDHGCRDGPRATATGDGHGPPAAPAMAPLWSWWDPLNEGARHPAVVLRRQDALRANLRRLEAKPSEEADDEAAAEEADDEAAAEGAEPGEEADDEAAAEEADDEAAAEGPEPGGGLLSVRTMPFSLCLLQKRAFESGSP